MIVFTEIIEKLTMFGEGNMHVNFEIEAKTATKCFEMMKLGFTELSCMF